MDIKATRASLTSALTLIQAKQEAAAELAERLEDQMNEIEGWIEELAEYEDVQDAKDDTVSVLEGILKSLSA